MALFGDAELGIEVVVAHGEILSVVPKCRNGVAVVVTHAQIGRAGVPGTTSVVPLVVVGNRFTCPEL